MAIEAVTTVKEFQPAQGYPKLEVLRDLGILRPYEILTQEEHIFTDRGGESFVLGYQLGVFDLRTGSQLPRFLKEKCIISFADPRDKAAEQYRRTQLLQANGVPTPVTYGVRGSTIYQEFVTNPRTREMITVIKRRSTPEAAIGLHQLAHIAIILDRLGFSPRGFIMDLIYDGDQGRFLYMDTGEDLGGEDPQHPNDNSLRHLIATFPDSKQEIEQYYTAIIQPAA